MNLMDNFKKVCIFIEYILTILINFILKLLAVILITIKLLFSIIKNILILFLIILNAITYISVILEPLIVYISSLEAIAFTTDTKLHKTVVKAIEID
jgi:hypothetical protein